MATIVGSIEYYQELINKATAELAQLREAKIALDNTYASWLTFQAKGYKNSLGRETCQNCCGRQLGECSQEDLANIAASRLQVVNQQKLIDDKIKQLTDLNTALANARALENAKTPEQRAAEEQSRLQEEINKRKNRTWVPVVLTIVVITAIVVGIFIYKRRK